MLEINGLFKQDGFLAPLPGVGEQLPPVVEHKVRRCNEFLMKLANEGDVPTCVHRIGIIFIRNVICNQRFVELAHHIPRRGDGNPQDGLLDTQPAQKPSDLTDQEPVVDPPPSRV